MNNKIDPIRKINRSEIIDAIKNSGYLLEQRVEPIISKYGYYVEKNDVYKDPDTGKTRETDLTAITGIPVFKKEDHMIFPYIVCECENNKQPIVFFRNESPISFMFHSDLKISGIPTHFFEKDDSSIYLTDFFKFEKFHHYCKGPFASQYCTFMPNKTKTSWNALHSEDQHDTFMSLIKAVQFQMQEHFDSWYPPEKNEKEYMNIQIYYPLLILQGDLFEAYLDNDQLKLKSIKHIHFRKQIVSVKETEVYQIDVVTESFLKEYLEIIDKEIDIIKNKLNRKRRDIESSIEILVKEAIKKKKKKTFRDILEF